MVRSSESFIFFLPFLFALNILYANQALTRLMAAYANFNPTQAFYATHLRCKHFIISSKIVPAY